MFADERFSFEMGSKFELSLMIRIRSRKCISSKFMSQRLTPGLLLKMVCEGNLNELSRASLLKEMTPTMIRLLYESYNYILTGLMMSSKQAVYYK